MVGRGSSQGTRGHKWFWTEEFRFYPFRFPCDDPTTAATPPSSPLRPLALPHMPPKPFARKSKKPRINAPPTSTKTKSTDGIDSGSILTSADKLRWKKVARPSQAASGSLDHEGGILELEEVDDVEVVYVDLPGGGRKVMFRVCRKRIFSESFSPYMSRLTVPSTSQPGQGSGS